MVFVVGLPNGHGLAGPTLRVNMLLLQFGSKLAAAAEQGCRAMAPALILEFDIPIEFSY